MSTKEYIVQKLIRKRQHLISRKAHLRQNDISIICNICVGGRIYHDLSLRFLSPTINLAIKFHDFVNFAESLEKYITDSDIVKDINASLTNDHPHGKLIVKGFGDILLDFRHYQTFEEAKQKWESRSHRINWNKIFILGYACVKPNEHFPWLNASRDDVIRASQLPYRKIIFVDDKRLCNLPGIRYSKFLDKHPNLSITRTTPYNIFSRYGIFSCAYDELDFIHDLYDLDFN